MIFSLSSGCLAGTKQILIWASFTVFIPSPFVSSQGFISFELCHRFILQMKFASIPKTIWEHKKKSAVGFVLSYFLARKVYRWKRCVTLKGSGKEVFVDTFTDLLHELKVHCFISFAHKKLQIFIPSENIDIQKITGIATYA